METIFNSRDLSLQEYSKNFEYFKEKFKIFEGLKKFQKIGKIPLSQKENKKKKEVEETLEKKKEEKDKKKKKTSRKEVGQPKTDNENKKNTKMIEEIKEGNNNEKADEKADEKAYEKADEKADEEVDEKADEEVDEENMYNSEDSKTESDIEDDKDEDCINDTNNDEENNKDVKVYCVYEAGFTQKLSRWWWSENREKTFKYLDDDFNEFVEFLDKIKLHTTSINYIFFSKLIKEICLYCNKIIPGLYNLKETYENISKIKAKIDSIIMILIDFKAEMAVLRKRQKSIYSKVKRV